MFYIIEENSMYIYIYIYIYHGNSSRGTDKYEIIRELLLDHLNIDFIPVL